MCEEKELNKKDSTNDGKQEKCPRPCRKCVQNDDDKTEKPLCYDCITEKICNCFGKKQDGYSSMEQLMLLIRIIIMVISISTTILALLAITLEAPLINKQIKKEWFTNC